MTHLMIAAASAAWLGILTSISPCPLATNIAATSVLTRRVNCRKRATAGILAYTFGRISAYLLLAGILMLGFASMPTLSAFLRQEVLPLVGPILILTGMAVIGWLPLPFEFKFGSADTANNISSWGIAGEFSLGALFALSFCPVSAALFFGSLVPLATTSQLSIFAVMIYGLGTALPVALIAFIALFSAEKAGEVIQRTQQWQKYAITLTGVVLIVVGCWLTLSDTLQLFEPS